LSRRPPGDLGALATLPRLQHDGVAAAHHHPLAGLDHMVVEVALAGEPHAAARHHEFTRAAMEMHGLAPAHHQDRVVRVRLRFHHESPGCRRFQFFASSQ